MASAEVFSWVPHSPDDLITCYIYNLITDEKIEFVVIPDGVNETYQAEWTTQDVIGRSAPFIAFMNNPARSVDYSIQLDRDILGDPFYAETIDKCKRLVYPNYTAGGLVIPPYCYVRFGGIVKMFAIVDSVGVSWSGTIISDNEVVPSSGNVYSGNTDPNENLYSQCELSFSFTELRTRNQPLPTGNNLYEVNKNSNDFNNEGFVSNNPPTSDDGTTSGNPPTYNKVDESTGSMIVSETVDTDPNGTITRRTETSVSSDGTKTIKTESTVPNLFGGSTKTTTTVKTDRSGNEIEKVEETVKDTGLTTQRTVVTTTPTSIVEEVIYDEGFDEKEQRVITTKTLNSLGEVTSTSVESRKTEQDGNTVITTSSDGSKVVVESSVDTDDEGNERAHSIITSFDKDGNILTVSETQKTKGSANVETTETVKDKYGKVISYNRTMEVMNFSTGELLSRNSTYRDDKGNHYKISEQTIKNKDGTATVEIITTDENTGKKVTKTITTDKAVEIIEKSGSTVEEYLDNYMPELYRAGKVTEDANAYGNGEFDRIFSGIMNRSISA